jgi:hypothetical protein
MLTLLPESLEHGLLSSASRFPPLQSIFLRLLWASSISMIGSVYAQCSHLFYLQERAPEEAATFGPFGPLTSATVQHTTGTYYCIRFASPTKVALHWLP